MQKKIISLLMIAVIGLTGCGTDDNGEETNTKQSNKTNINLDKDYTGSLENSSIQSYVLDNVKKGNSYYFHILNKGDKNSNPSLTEVQFSINDENGFIKNDEIDVRHPEKTYEITAEKDGKLYIEFKGDSDGSRYQFDIKPSFDDGLVQDQNTYEYNNFRSVAYPIELQTTYKSSVTYTSDVDDWYVLKNISSSQEHFFHLINLGDRNENTYSTELQYEIYDSDGKITSGSLGTPNKEETISFTPLNDSNVYIRFTANHFHPSGKYEFDVN